MYVLEGQKVVTEELIPKGNKVTVVETRVLFMDMRSSTDLSNSIGIRNMTKIYKMFGTIAAMAINENNGLIFQFSGDGFMAAFNSGNNNNFRLNAFNAVCIFHDLLNNVYKSIFPKEWHFDCGYAISTGHIYMTRLKSKAYKLHSFGVFPGNATNTASKFCDYANKKELIIDQKTYDHIKKYQKFKEKLNIKLKGRYYSWKLD